MKSFAIFKMNGTDAYYWLPFDRYQKPTCMQCLYQIETATFMFHLNGYIECFGWHQFGPNEMKICKVKVIDTNHSDPFDLSKRTFDPIKLN